MKEILTGIMDDIYLDHLEVYGIELPIDELYQMAYERLPELDMYYDDNVSASEFDL